MSKYGMFLEILVIFYLIFGIGFSKMVSDYTGTSFSLVRMYFWPVFLIVLAFI